MTFFIGFLAGRLCSSSRSRAEITCTNERLRVTATRPSRGSTLDLPAVTELAEQSCQLARAGGSGSVLVLCSSYAPSWRDSADRLVVITGHGFARQPPPRGAQRLPELRRREGHPLYCASGA
jgi:hypothetical protein